MAVDPEPVFDLKVDFEHGGGSSGGLLSAPIPVKSFSFSSFVIHTINIVQHTHTHTGQQRVIARHVFGFVLLCLLMARVSLLFLARNVYMYNNNG